jgi:hypothetical protein
MIETTGDVLKGFALIVSNIGLLPVIGLCIHYGLIPEAGIYTVVCFISSLYHLCQADFLCVYSFRSLQTSDHFFVFGLLVWTTLYFIGLNLKVKFIIFIVIQSLLLPAVIQYLESWWIGGVLLVFLLLLTISVLSQVTDKIRAPDFLDLSIASVLIGGGFYLHLYAGEPGAENYWWAHALWHLLGMFSLFFIIQMKNGNGTLHNILIAYRNEKPLKGILKKNKEINRMLNDV